jgi:hypothetical protein
MIETIIAGTDGTMIDHDWNHNIRPLLKAMTNHKLNHGRSGLEPLQTMFVTMTLTVSRTRIGTIHCKKGLPFSRPQTPRLGTGIALTFFTV